ncbi:T9SS type A sorting domain-containing protein, partial [Crocinitomix sp.]|nr:T9SS type A sorting domain-containing protein [Crocinitomix sp.]
HGSGGGGSFVVTIDNTPLIVAGGGGGHGKGSPGINTETDGTTGEAGQSPPSGSPGGTGGGGGSAAAGALGGTADTPGSDSPSSVWASGGGGFFTNGGACSFGTVPGGRAFMNGGRGGDAAETGALRAGGFGGGGGAGDRGAGGGGYSGGGGGTSDSDGGGGGGSYNDGINQDNEGGYQSGNGSVIITPLCVSLTVDLSDEDICIGDSFIVESVSETGGIIFWDGGLFDGVEFTPAAIGSYTFNATSTSGTDCGATIEVVVHDLPTIIANADPETVCFGQELTLSGSGGAYYDWSPGDIENGVPFVPAMGTMTYTVEGEDWYGCFNTAEVTVDVVDAPVVMANATDDNICLGESITLTGSGAVTYEWDMGVEDGVSFTPETSGTFEYNVDGFVDGDGCFGEASIEITVNEVPTIDSYETTEEVLGLDGGINITVSGGTPAYDFDWDNDGAGEFGDPEDLTGIVGGTYIVVVKDANGCEDSETILVDSQSGIESDQIGTITVYPNPTEDMFTINVDGYYTFELTSYNGQLITSGYGISSKTISLKEQPAGIYFLTVSLENGSETIKIVKN